MRIKGYKTNANLAIQFTETEIEKLKKGDIAAMDIIRLELLQKIRAIIFSPQDEYDYEIINYKTNKYILRYDDILNIMVEGKWLKLYAII